MELTEEVKKQIDDMDVETLLAKNRFSKIGDPWFQGKVGDYLLARLAKLRDENPEAYTQASKDIGWR
jgi:hypothetical protein